MRTHIHSHNQSPDPFAVAPFCGRWAVSFSRVATGPSKTMRRHAAGWLAMRKRKEKEHSPMNECPYSTPIHPRFCPGTSLSRKST